MRKSIFIVQPVMLPMRVLAPQKGFTIIELLVVLAVIGLIATSVVALFSTTRARSRDARREADMKTLQQALELYATNARAYPATDGDGECITGTDPISSVLVTAGVANAIPRDPLHDCAGAYHYQYIAPDPSTYRITYALETDSIPGKSCGNPPCTQQVEP